MSVILHGDALELMKDIPGGSVDAIVTDPPFGIDGEESADLIYQALAAIEWKVAAIIMDWRNPIIHPRKIGELIWRYGWVSGYRAKAKSGVCHTHNTIHLLGDARLMHFTDGSIIEHEPGMYSPRHCSFAHKTGHPYEKPVALMTWLLNRMDIRTVLDPFAGSGTTALGCIETGKDYILIEKDDAYYEMAKERLKNTNRPLGVSCQPSK